LGFQHSEESPGAEVTEQKPAPSEPAAGHPGLPPNLNRRLISLTDAAEMLGMSVGSVRRLIWAGKLHIVKLNRRVLVDLRDIDRLIEEAKDRRSW
jgi:excisionase family DNA binding protein